MQCGAWWRSLGTSETPPTLKGRHACCSEHPAMELRKQPRVALAFRVVAYFKDIPIAVEAIDVSTGGIAVRSSRRLEPGSGVRMNFFLSDGRPTEIDAVIVRALRLSSTIWLWGVAFRGL